MGEEEGEEVGECGGGGGGGGGVSMKLKVAVIAQMTPTLPPGCLLNSARASQSRHQRPTGHSACISHGRGPGRPPGVEAKGVVDRIFHGESVHGPASLGQSGLGGAPGRSVVQGACVALVTLVHAHGLNVGARAVCTADEAALREPKARLTW